MINKSLALYFLCLSALSVSAQSADVDGDQSNDRTCKYDGKPYAIGSSLNTSDHGILKCKVYDAIIPKTSDRLIKGYAYWDKQITTSNTNVELPRELFSKLLPLPIAKSNP